jgi:hypothetical protein
LLRWWLLYELLRCREGLREALVEADLIHSEVVEVALWQGRLACLLWLLLLLGYCFLCWLTELAKEVFLLIIE